MIKKKNYETRFLKSTKGIKSSNCLIDDTYFHIAYGEQLVAIEVNNPIFFQVQSLLFDTLRENIGKN